MKNKSIIYTILGNNIEINRDLLTGKCSINLVKHRVAKDLIPNLVYPVHSNYKSDDGYQLNIGDEIDLLAKLDETYWAIKKVGVDTKPYVISDQMLKNVLLTIGNNYC